MCWEATVGQSTGVVVSEVVICAQMEINDHRIYVRIYWITLSSDRD